MASSQPLAFAALLVGGVAVTSVVTGTSIADVVKGKVNPVTTSTALQAGASGVGTPGPAITPNAAGYVNPIPGATIGRVDMGVDANLSPGKPIVALGNSKVVGILQNWYSGQPFVWFQLLDGPQAGKYWYVAEQITPSVKPGDVVAAGQPVGTYSSSGTGLELGWATASGATLAQATGNTGDAQHNNAPAGQDFRNFLHSLGI